MAFFDKDGQLTQFQIVATNKISVLKKYQVFQRTYN